jgi:hypothetical protein
METAGYPVTPSLESRLASELRRLVARLPVGTQFAVPPSADLCSVLELFLPQLLRDRYPEWMKESLDGIFVAHAEKSGPAAVKLVGTCILISDQTVTPFLINLRLSPGADCLAAYRILLGEPGGGPLGISGPACNSNDAERLLGTLISRLDDVEWSYEVASGA